MEKFIIKRWQFIEQIFVPVAKAENHDMAWNWIKSDMAQKPARHIGDYKIEAA